MLEDDPLDQDGEQQHHPQRADDREDRGHLPAEAVDLGAQHGVDQLREGHLPVLKADQRQRREQGHDALRIVEDARGLEDQNEAERDERIHHSRQQAVQDHLDRVKKFGAHAAVPSLWIASMERVSRG